MLIFFLLKFVEREARFPDNAVSLVAESQNASQPVKISYLLTYTQ
ncbi:hypothetical protein F385_1716 [Pantoea agglomerans 299R]|nr:hypothetical protein F385_1716 [Pantoea agglomerans 299R]